VFACLNCVGTVSWMTRQALKPAVIGMVNGMVNVDLYSAIITKVSNVLNCYVSCLVCRKYCRMAHGLSPVDQLIKNLELARLNESFYNEYCTMSCSSHLTCTNGVSPDHLPVIVASDRP